MRRAVAALSAIVLSGCAGPIELAEPSPAGTTATVCQALMADLPARVLDQERRDVRPGRFAAAWGDPTIVLRCGGAKPPGLGASSECFEVNGVGWFAEPGASGGFLFTTIGRPAFVELAVPSAYAPEASALVDVAAAIQRHDPSTTPCV